MMMMKRDKGKSKEEKEMNGESRTYNIITILKMETKQTKKHT